MTRATESLFGVEGKVVLVTGGSRGIGYMLARGLVAAGATVVISSRKADACDRAARELSEIGACTSLPADVSTQAGCQDLAARVLEASGTLDVLVNNAGSAWVEPFDSFPASAWDKVLDLNLKAPFYLAQALVGVLEAAARPGDPARIINIGSIEGLSLSGMPLFSYAASKAGLHHLTRLLARELGPRGVTVNAIAPGPFETRLAKVGLDAGRERFVTASALARLGEPDDIVGAAQYLASRAGAFVTGTVLVVDGGISAAW